MKILIYGAGPLGSLFAARLHEAGHSVALLSRGQRLAELRERGVVLIDGTTGERSTTRLEIVETLSPQDSYELVLVIMRRNRVDAILPTLAAAQIPTVLFLMNNASGPGPFVEALGQERVLIGFPSAAGVREGHAIRYLAGTEKQPSEIPFGEVDGRITERTRQVAAVLSSMRGFKADIRTDMDAWHKTHIALLMPSIVPALYATGCDPLELARRRDLLTMLVSAVREGFAVLRALGIPITPARIRRLAWIPTPLLVRMLQKMLPRDAARIALVGHALAAPDELRYLADEFIALARTTDVPIPSIEQLYPCFDLPQPHPPA